MTLIGQKATADGEKHAVIEEMRTINIIICTTTRTESKKLIQVKRDFLKRLRILLMYMTNTELIILVALKILKIELRIPLENE